MSINTLPSTGIIGDPGVSLSTDGMLGLGATNLYVSGISPESLGDDGGWQLTIFGAIPKSKRYLVTILDNSDPNWTAQTCYSGKAGEGNAVATAYGDKLVVYVPNLPIGGPYDVVVTSTDEVATDDVEDSLTIIHRSATTNLYKLRSHWPPPRNVGPHSLDQED